MGEPFYLKSILLKDFRNYRHEKIDFHSRVNLVTGDNAQGKSNLLEAIYYLSVTRSFRTRRDHELANLSGGSFFIQGMFFKGDYKHQVSTGYNSSSQLKITVNNAKVRRFEYLHDYPVIAFSPDDLMLVSGGPNNRRSFINLEASRLSERYLHELKRYQKIILHRNRLLKDHRFDKGLNELLAPWDDSLAAAGTYISRYRSSLIDALNKEVQDVFMHLTSNEENIFLKHASNIAYAEDPVEMKDNYLQRLKYKRSLEIKKCSTMYGPHLDDIVISINGEDTRRFSSQGQKRTAALALKIGALNLIRNHHDLNPIVLLDDVFSELDARRKKCLLQFIDDRCGQFFISTAVASDSVLTCLGSDYKLMRIHRGTVKDETSGTTN